MYHFILHFFSTNVTGIQIYRYTGVVLPWVRSAVHLGHTLHQGLTMSADAGVRRARFISSSDEVRSHFSFATPVQILRAVKVLSCDAYGLVLWRLDSEAATSF